MNHLPLNSFRVPISVNSTTSHLSQKPETQASSLPPPPPPLFPLIYALIPHNISVAKFCSIPHSKFLRIYPLLCLSLSLPSIRQPSSPVLITTSERINQYPGLPPSNPLPTVELELLFSNTWGRLFTSRLLAQAHPSVLCFMMLELEVCKLHFPDSLATGFLFNSAVGSHWQIGRQRWGEGTLPFSSACQTSQ